MGAMVAAAAITVAAGVYASNKAEKAQKEAQSEANEMERQSMEMVDNATNRQIAVRRESAASFDKLREQMPELKESEFREMQSQFEYDPVLREDAFELEDSEMEGVSTDPRLQNAQMNALTKLSQIGEDGFTPIERVELARTSDQISGDEQARQGQLMQQMAAQGMSGSGVELAAKLSSNQAAAQMHSGRARDIEALGFQRALDAASRSGQLGGAMRQQEFGEKSSIANAQDIVNQFNTNNRNTVADRNNELQNKANLLVAQQRQSLYEANIAEQRRLDAERQQLEQQRYNNTADITKNKANIMSGVASDIGAGARANQSSMSAMASNAKAGGAAEAARIQATGSAVGQLAGVAAGAYKTNQTSAAAPVTTNKTVAYNYDPSKNSSNIS